ncbi:MAG: glycosyltransferase 87 family protein [Thermoplasmata archaeon]|nr:glycosyltransferase 87 family protein [Thermoplasmata archaeon]
MTFPRVKELLWGDGVRRTRTAIAVAFLVACVAYLLVVHYAGIETEVIRDRYWKNAVPFFTADFPVMEYPPLAIVIIAIPYLFGNTPWGYETAYVAMAYVFMVAGLFLISRLARAVGHEEKRPMIAYGILMMLMLEFVLDRFDVFVMVITLAAVVMMVEKRYPWAFLLLALGTLVKVYPAILFPIFFLYLLYNRRPGDAVLGFGIYTATGLVITALCWFINPDIILNFIGYNGGRSLQIESVAASVVYFLGVLGLTDVSIAGASEATSWSDNLVGAVPDALATILLPLMVVCVVAIWVLYAVKRARGDGDRNMRLFALACVACLLMFLVVNKVYSSQYIIWLIGALIFLVLVSDFSFNKRMVALTVAIILFTQLNFAYNIGYLGGGENIDTLGMGIILVRNLLTVAMLVVVLREMAVVGSGAEPEGWDPWRLRSAAPRTTRTRLPRVK